MNQSQGMSRFERVMEAWGLLTMDLMRSDVWWRRWLGTALGTLAVVLMGIVMGLWRLFGKKPR